MLKFSGWYLSWWYDSVSRVMYGMHFKIVSYTIDGMLRSSIWSSSSSEFGCSYSLWEPCYSVWWHIKDWHQGAMFVPDASFREAPPRLLNIKLIVLHLGMGPRVYRSIKCRRSGRCTNPLGGMGSGARRIPWCKKIILARPSKMGSSVCYCLGFLDYLFHIWLNIIIITSDLHLLASA